MHAPFSQISPVPQSTQSPLPIPIPATPVAPSPSLLEAAAQNSWQAALKRPGELISFAVAHFTNSQIQSVLIFPTTYRGIDSAVAFLAHRDLAKYLAECCSLSSYKHQVPYWRLKWKGAIPSQSILPILFSILIVATGFQTAWNKHRLAL